MNENAINFRTHKSSGNKSEFRKYLNFMNLSKIRNLSIRILFPMKNFYYPKLLC